MDQRDTLEEDPTRPKALEQLNAILVPEGFEAFYGDDHQCYVRHIKANAVAVIPANPHRAFTAAEQKKRAELEVYLDKASEDELIEELLLPLFRQLGFQRITAAGHKDKSHEYGKDAWMKYTLPTMHVIYFGLQAKKGKLDASGMPKASNVNMAEIHNQVLMMLGHEVFDPELNRRALVDHAFIVAGGEITKAARTWIGNKLDASRRSQILFMDRNHILDLFVVNNIPLPTAALPNNTSPWDEPPF
jgi:hypothetical protein